MKTGRFLLSLAIGFLFLCKADAQIIKAFNSVGVADNYTLRLEGNKNTTVKFNWTSADLNKPGVSIEYLFQLDTINGTFNNPWVTVGKTCCSSFFPNDTTMDVTLEHLLGELDYLYSNRFGKKFKHGDSITLDWNIKCNGIGPNATYENKSTVARRITFIRGQFDSEYVPVKLSAPLDNSSFFVEDNNSVFLKFQWSKAYCPAGCNAPQYQIMFDSLGGDFSNPLYFYSVPQSPFDTLLDLRQDVLAQMMYDDGIPVNMPKTYKWTVNVFGNGEEFFAIAPRRISLLRGLMRFEHIPFYIQTPVDNAVIKLEKNINDSIIFNWNKTKTGYPDDASYSILFSDVTANFAKPLFSFKTAVGDTNFVARYGEMRDSLDKTYGKNWLTKQLKWTVEADIIGYKFMCEDTNDMTIARGFFTGFEAPQELSAKVYPNPANDYLNIILNNEKSVKLVEICDALGRVMKTITITSEGRHINLNINNLMQGVYYIRMQDENGWVRPIPFIKQ